MAVGIGVNSFVYYMHTPVGYMGFPISIEHMAALLVIVYKTNAVIILFIQV